MLQNQLYLMFQDKKLLRELQTIWKSTKFKNHILQL